MVPEINYWAMELAALSGLVVGSVWYTPKVFGDRWTRLARVQVDDRARSAIRLIVVALLMSFVTAWVLAGASALAWHFYGGSYLVTALATGAILWAGFTAARFITQDAFEGRPPALTTINIAHELVAVLVMAVIIGVWPPAGTV